MSGCGHTFYQTAPLEHNNLTGTNRICTRATSCGNVRDSTTGWHYMFRVGNMATKVSEGYPEYNSGGLHEGIDIIHSTWGLVNNMPVYSVGSGTINYAGWYGGGYGNVVQLKIGSNIVWYTHLGNNTINVSYGMSVKEDRLLGRVGDTQSPGAFHLHFEIRNSNNAKNGGASEFDPRDWYPQSGVFTY
jgi:murein DD-endopeptidase MepM/ murein hydrolase activator NlpD